MVYNRETMIGDVRRMMNENWRNEPIAGMDDCRQLRLDDLITMLMPEAAKDALLQAPMTDLEQGHTFGDAVHWGHHCNGWVLLPDDFLRLVCFKMSDWDVAVYHAVYADDPLYYLQYSPFESLRGCPQKPVCALVNRPEGQALEFFSCADRDAWVERAQYVPLPAYDRHGGLDISRRCYDRAVALCAERCRRALEYDNLKK